MRLAALMLALFACSGSQPARETAPDRRTCSTKYGGWCCAVSTDAPPAGVCGRTHDECEWSRSQMAKQARPHAPCRWSRVAACHTYRLKPEQRTIQSCHPSMTACEQHRESLLTEETGDAELVSECVAVE